MTKLPWRQFTVGFLLLLSASASASGFVASRGAKAGVQSAPARPARAQLVRAEGATLDQKTGLPTRVVHRASGVVLVLIPAGEFLMGSPADEVGRGRREDQHRRVIRRPFYLGETEVTVAQFRRFVEAAKYETDAERGVEEGGHFKGAFATTSDGKDPREWSASPSWRNPFPSLKDYRLNDRHPVVQVSWNDARRFVEHYGMRLPTEAEWEYAARAGSRTPYFWGESECEGRGYGNVRDAAGQRRYPTWGAAFPFDDGAALLSVVGRYQANAWGVRDMVGNVSEWCEDAYGAYPAGGGDETAAGGSSAARVLRGSAWLDMPDFSRSAKRLGFAPQGRRDFIGFRVALTAAAVK
jgi:formylglycine-generating enzyme required for sulfatase activity